MTAPLLPSSVRWRIVWLLVGFSLVSYVERMNISVAAKFFAPELSLDQVQLGQIFSAFVLGYAALQIPMGMLADRIGPYRLLSVLGWLWALLTMATGVLPGWLTGPGAPAFVTLVAIRFVLGLTIAGVYPLCARTTANWMPTAERAFAYSLVIAGVSIGSALTPPLVAWLMTAIGWRESFYLTAVPGVLISLLWMRLGADHPGRHRGISELERDYIVQGQGEQAAAPAAMATWLALLRNRSLLLLAVSYFFIGYVLYVFVFWFYTYLVDVRKFGIVGSGFFTSLPFIVAFILSPIGGKTCDALTARYGTRTGRRATAMIGVLLAATCLLVGVRTEQAYLAVAALSLAFGLQMFAESAYWSSAMDIAGRGTGAAGGLINTVNNLGGVVSTALTPVLIERFGWTTAFNVCVGVSVVAALLWLGIRADQTIGAGGAAASPMNRAGVRA